MNASCKERKKRCFRFFSVAFVLSAIFSVLAGTFFALQPSAYAEEVDATLPVKKSEQLTTGTTGQKSTGQFLPDQGYFDTGLVEDKAVLMKNDDDDDDGPIKTCMNSGAGKSLGWVLCPILEFLSESATKTYNTYVKPSLQIEPALFSTDQFNGSTFKAWETFRNFANIAFIILFIVVIISQITGVGINNYGIKKILPKLIVAAVLVNVSYFICQILIDVSNIVGNSIQSLFEGLANSAELKSIQDDFQIAVASGDKTTELISIGAKTTLSSVAIIGAIAGVGAIIINPAILLSLLVSAIGIVISIFTLFILLSARQALVVVLTVLSPVAFVCFMLPNTKGLFDKWLKIMKAMLLVYPICGLLVGGGDYVSKLILSLASTESDSFFIALTAMIVGIVPIFFIPKVLRDAFDGVGKLGAKITDYGKSIRGRATSAARSSNFNKEMQRRGMERRTRITAGIDKNGNARKLGVVGTLLHGGERNIANARSQYLQDKKNDDRIESYTKGIGFDAASINQRKAFEKEQLGEYITLINDKTRNGDNKEELYRLYDSYLNDGNKTGAVAVARIAGRRKDTAADFLARKITGTGEGVDSEKLFTMNQAHKDIFDSVAKEIATGDNSGTYKDSAPIGFQFASSHHSVAGGATDAQGNPLPQPSVDYVQWRDSLLDSEDAGKGTMGEMAIKNYITNTKELMGAKGSSLKEIASLMESGKLSGAERDRLAGLANMAIQNKGVTGVWDSTKEPEIYKIASLGTTGTVGGSAGGPAAGPTGGGSRDSGLTGDSGPIIHNDRGPIAGGGTA